jgi:cob(I)alamin adenosyltransferase
MKIYTKTGDKGETGLYGGKRVSKSDKRIEAYGTIDELNAFIGLLLDSIDEPDIKITLNEVQDRLFTIGSSLASDPEKINTLLKPDLNANDILLLETKIDEYSNNLPPLKHFILPSGNVLISTCHVARTICRRAERNVIALHKVQKVDELIIQYLNRLSDYLFILSRQIAKILSVEEKKWIPRT